MTAPTIAPMWLPARRRHSDSAGAAAHRILQVRFSAPTARQPRQLERDPGSGSSGCRGAAPGTRHLAGSATASQCPELLPDWCLLAPSPRQDRRPTVQTGPSALSPWPTGPGGSRSVLPGSASAMGCADSLFQLHSRPQPRASLQVGCGRRHSGERQGHAESVSHRIHQSAGRPLLVQASGTEPVPSVCSWRETPCTC